MDINLKYVEEVMPELREWLIGPEGQKWKNEREAKDRFFMSYFSISEIPKLNEGTLREMIYLLWAFNGWTNKDYLLQEMLKSGLPNIQDAFLYLLHSKDSLAKRFDRIRSNVRMMGAACVSEILAHTDHERYPIWNARSKAGLMVLGLTDKLPKRAQISGAQYATFCDVAINVLTMVRSAYPEIKDLFELDFLLFYISIRKTLQQVTIDEKPVTSFDHGNTIDEVLQLGDGLGFEVEEEFKVGQGCKIDAIWRSRIGNLGTIKYAFEVHNKGSRDSAILNLQRIRRDPSVQKVILVSTENELKALQGEIALLSEDFRTSVGYLRVDDLQRALEHLESMKAILKTVGLLGTRLPN